MTAVGRFLGGVAALVYHQPTATYLLLRRQSSRDFGAGQWECVTGRVDQGEGFEHAVRREVREELGVEVTLDFIIGTTHFYRGEPSPETELLGVLYVCGIEDRGAVVVSDEHDEHRWVSADDALALLPAGHWLRATIGRAETMRQLLPAALVERNRTDGFESA